MLDLDDRVEISPAVRPQARAQARAGLEGRLRLRHAGGRGGGLRRAGKQVLNVDEPGRPARLPAEGDHVAVIGDNGKLLIFPLDELPEMPRGKGVKLQSYKEGGLATRACSTRPTASPGSIPPGARSRCRGRS